MYSQKLLLIGLKGTKQRKTKFLISKTAKSIISKFETNNFDDIYIYDENGFHIADLYFAYLTKYFQEQD